MRADRLRRRARGVVRKAQPAYVTARAAGHGRVESLSYALAVARGRDAKAPSTGDTLRAARAYGRQDGSPGSQRRNGHG